MYYNTSGSFKTASGTSALLQSSTGSYNTATGYAALYGDAAYRTTAGSYNTGNGYFALYHNTTGSNNTADGSNALLSNATGSNNTAAGYQADVADGLTNATAIGNGAAVKASNKIRLGNSSVTVVEAQGDFHSAGPGNGIILKSPNGIVCRRLTIDNTGTLVTTAVVCP